MLHVLASMVIVRKIQVRVPEVTILVSVVGMRQEDVAFPV